MSNASLNARRSGPARAAATRSATVEAGDAVDPINTDREKIRRARKRATDRQSQRDHRERQRIYIRELEETVQYYKDTFSSDGSSESAALLKEQERLQTRCKSLEAALARIKNLASAVHFSEDVCSDPDPNNSFARKPQQANVSTSQPLAEFDSSGSSHGPESCGDHGPPPHPHAGQPVSGDRVIDVSAQLLPHEIDYFDLSCDHAAAFNTATLTERPVDSSHDPTGLDLPMPLVNQEDGVEELGARDDLDRCIASIVDGTATGLDLVPNSVATRNALLAEPAIQADFSEDVPTHLSFPKLCHNMGNWDKILLSMVDEARLQHRRGQFDTSEPSLRSLLSDKSTDVLAYRLFHHICSYGSIPLHLLLSIFWVQYLFLRWYVLGTWADFIRVPEFLRPTDLERRIQHRPCIGMLVWPDLRRALIRDSHTTDPERIGIDVLKHINPMWSPTAHGNGDFIGSTDVFAIIEHQAQRMESWKVDSRFQEKYLQFAGCRLG